MADRQSSDSFTYVPTGTTDGVTTDGGPGSMELARGVAWCRTCGGRHTPEPCFRDYQATGTERHGWRALIEDRGQPEVFGVLVAPVRAGWRARILTYPNCLWMVPGGGASMKFIGATATQAETEAVLFLQDYCKAKRLTISRRLPNLETGPIDREESAATRADARAQAARRRVKHVPLWWGTESADEEGLSEDFSESGLFLISGKLQPKGTKIVLRIEVGGSALHLTGTVAWRREIAAGGKRIGMGVDLSAPPQAYIEFVRSLP